MSVPIFPKHDPASADFWNLRFAAAFTPWDQGSVPQCLQTWARAYPGRAPRVLIPGCGSAWEVKFLAGLGWEVSAIDFSTAAVARARQLLGALAGLVREADFFAAAPGEATFEVIYERAFLCALPRRLWPQWAARVAELLPPGGVLAGFFFADGNEKGPPFGLHGGELETLLQPRFTRVEQRAPEDSIAVFAGKESWQVWRRNG